MIRITKKATLNKKVPERSFIFTNATKFWRKGRKEGEATRRHKRGGCLEGAGFVKLRKSGKGDSVLSSKAGEKCKKRDAAYIHPSQKVGGR